MSSPTRQLAAIMFTDIVGYTKIMGADEERALKLLDKNREIHSAFIKENNGQILKEMGDGILARFHSVTDAVFCGTKLLEAVAEISDLTLRIGIHIGEVVIENEDVFGDGVNIASRIQGKAPPGSIYVSESVKNNLSNKKDFGLRYVGNTALKHVKNRVRIYEVTPESGNKVSIQKNRRILLIVASTLMIGGIVMFLWFYVGSRDPTPSEDIRNAKIAVLPFENNTNDPNLDMFGEMAADWIIHRLMDLGNLKLVSFQNVQDNLRYAAAGSINDQFISGTGAEKLINGRFYQENDKLIINTWITDIKSGEIEMVLDEITGDKNDLTELVQRVSTRFQSYFADNTFQGKLNPPTYDAYTDFRKGLAHFGVDYEKASQFFDTSIQKDSTFLLAYIWTGVLLGNTGQFQERDSLLTLIERKFDRFSRFEGLLIDWQKTVNAGDYRNSYTIWKEIISFDPMDISMNYSMTYVCINLNKPREALEYFHLIDAENLTTEFPYVSWWYFNHALCHIRINEPDEALKVLNYLDPVHRSTRYFRLKTLVHTRYHAEDSITQILEDQSNDLMRIRILMETVKNSMISEKNDWAGKYAMMAVNLIENLPFESRSPFADAYLWAGRYDDALRFYKKMSGNPNNWQLMSKIGTCQARLGQNENAQETIDVLLKPGHPAYKGRKKYGAARIYAQMGETEKAIELLSEAFEIGYGIRSSIATYELDPLLLPIRSHSFFQQFLHPTD